MKTSSEPGAASSQVAVLLSLKVCHPARPEVVPVFRHAVAEFAAEHGAAPDLCADVALAVSEAVTNAVKHSGVGAKESITLTADIKDGWLDIVVRDRGRGFGTAESDGLGLGLSIIARLSARMTICQEGRGTEVRMSFPMPRK